MLKHLWIFILISFQSAFGQPVEWIDELDPVFYPASELQFSRRQFENLPLAGTVAHKKVNGYQWYALTGGLNYRRFSQKRSPGEKLQAIVGEKVVNHWFSSVTAPWTGLCNGVSNLHSIAEIRKESQWVRGLNGQRILLEPADVHAIASFAMAKAAERTPIIGKRCNHGRRLERCSGMNAAIFHLLLANEVGLNQRDLIMDIHADRRVDNLRVYRYESQVVRDQAQALLEHHYRVIEVVTRVHWPKKVVFNADDFLTEEEVEKDYRYQLWVDSTDQEIKGGSWISSERTDFAWRPRCHRFEGVFEFLNELLEWKC